MEQFLASYVFETVISSAIFYLLYLLILKKNTNHQFNRFYLLTAPVISAALPFINFQTDTTKNVLKELSIISYSDFVLENIVANNLSANANTIQTNSDSGAK